MGKCLWNVISWLHIAWFRTGITCKCMNSVQRNESRFYGQNYIHGLVVRYVGLLRTSCDVVHISAYHITPHYFQDLMSHRVGISTLKCCSWFLITCVGILRMSCRYSCLKFLLLILLIFLATGLDTSTPGQSSLSDKASLFINQDLEITFAC